jgi:hypothetical protein
LLLDGALQGVRAKGIIIRNDNGSQFLAHNVRKYLDKKEVVQEFTHIATPEENAYIESLHSSLERELINRSWFDSLYHARMKIRDYYMIYNYRRKHRSLKKRSPYKYIQTYFPEYAAMRPFAAVASEYIMQTPTIQLGAGGGALSQEKEIYQVNIETTESQKILLN